jgi:hypothetical protein
MSPLKSLTVLAAVLGLACATSASREMRPEERFPVEKRPAKSPDCAFDLYEQFAPTRPHRAIGTVPLTLAVSGRDDAFSLKGLLRKTVCKTGADAVRLEPLQTRIIGRSFEREFRASLLVYTEAPTPP